MMTITDESLPPLTTVFVPPPECSSFHFSCDIDFDRASPYLLTDCIPCAFPVRICGTNLEGSRSLLNCYPHVRTLRGTEFAKYFSDFDFVRPVETYVSGVSCPLGMDTAAQVAKKDGSETKICCPRYFSWNGFECEAGIQNEIVTFYQEDCAASPYVFTYDPQGQDTHTVGDLTFTLDREDSAWASPIILIRTLGTTSDASGPLAIPIPRTSVSPSNTLPFKGTTLPGTTSKDLKQDPSNTPPRESSQVLSQTGRIGVAIGVTVFFLLVFTLATTVIIRHRRRNRNSPPHQTPNPRHSSYKGKPELEGTIPSHEPKPELDAMAIRAELEGLPGEEGGDGVYVVKPELEGTPSQQGIAGRRVFVGGEV